MFEGHEFAPINFVLPDITKERGEFDRVATKYGLDSETLQFLASGEGSLQDLSSEIWEKLDNTESNNLQKDDWEAVREISEKYDRDYEDLKKKIENNVQIDAPIIMSYGDIFHVVSGNTRLMVARALGVTPQYLSLNIFMTEQTKMTRCIVGVDEAGRGPLAGPVSIGIAVAPRDFDWMLIPGVNDSKKLTEKKREIIFLHTQKLKKTGKLNYHVSLVSASHIDRYGISHAIRKGIEDGLKKLALNPETAKVLLDGSLKAPKIFTDQETIIKGDAKEKIIGLASIMAKVTRDRYMVQVAKKYPNYNFEIHKGYGTKKHCDAIERHGISALHRKSFCKRFLS